MINPGASSRPAPLRRRPQTHMANPELDDAHAAAQNNSDVPSKVLAGTGITFRVARWTAGARARRLEEVVVWWVVWTGGFFGLVDGG